MGVIISESVTDVNRLDVNIFTFSAASHLSFQLGPEAIPNFRPK